MTKRMQNRRRYYHYNYCHRCLKKANNNLICNSLLDEENGLYYYCSECHKKWTEIFVTLNNNNRPKIKEEFRRFIGTKKFMFR